MKSEAAIKVKHVSKAFHLPHEKVTSIKSAIVNFRSKRTFEKQEVLRDVSFEIKKGEFFGVVGRNGSGKSTLLKLLAGIYSADNGEIDINGKLTPFIELGVGFNPELTGRENVYLNGALLGFSRSEMTAMYDDIVSFAELDRFMDQKLKNYSSGMQVRLAFSIAIQAKSDILLLDEVLAVGDAAFQRKCFEYFGDLKRNKQTVVFISHDMASVRKYCDRAIMIDKGVIVHEGSTEKVINEYSKLFIDTEVAPSPKSRQYEVPLGMSPEGQLDKDKVFISNPRIVAKSGKPVKSLDKKETMLRVRFDVTALSKEVSFVPGVIVQNSVGEFITATNAIWADNGRYKTLKKGETSTVAFDLPNLYEKGDYKVSLNAVSSELDVFYAWKNAALKMYIDRPYETGAKIYPRFDVRYE